MACALALALLVLVGRAVAETPVNLSIVTFASVGVVWILRRRIHTVEGRYAEAIAKAAGLIKEGKHEDAAVLVEDIAGELVAEPFPRLHADRGSSSTRSSSISLAARRTRRFSVISSRAPGR